MADARREVEAAELHEAALQQTAAQLADVAQANVQELRARAGFGPDFAFDQAALDYRAARPLRLDPDRYERDRERLALLLQHEKVRAAVRRQLQDQEHGLAQRYGNALADKLDELRPEGFNSETGELAWQPMAQREGERWHVAPFDGLGLRYDHEAAARLRKCVDPEQMLVGTHVHLDATQPDGLGAVMVKVERERCWLRVCPRCRKDHARRLQRHYQQVLSVVVAAQLEHNRELAKTSKARYGLWHLVLTAKTFGDDRADEEKAHEWTRKLVKHFWPDQGPKGWEGALGSYERGAVGDQPHVHCIVSGRWVSKFDISAYWYKVTDGQGYIVYKRPIAPGRALGEAVKYASKLGTLKGADNLELAAARDRDLHMALKGRRRVWSWGCFYWSKARKEAYRLSHPGAPVPNEDPDADSEPAGADEDVEIGECCPSCREPMAFLPVPEVRALLGNLTGANKSRPASSPASCQAPAAGPAPP